MFEILLGLLSPRCQPLFYYFNFILEEKKVNLGNMGYDSGHAFILFS
jgi:hypothetical protein